MERLSFVKNGVLRLPPGFRFHPTDEELVVHYLKRKVLAYPLPASIIPEADVCKSDPWDLPGEAEKERYFLGTREVKYPNGNRSNRATGSGYWKATGSDKQIVGSKSNQIVGMKKVHVFYRGRPPKGCRTDWIMHEYRLIDSPQANNSPHENWVVCRIFLKKRGSKSDEEAVQTNGGRPSRPAPIFYDFMARERVDSSGSSGVTEISKRNESDDHEGSSCNSMCTSLRSRQ